MFWPTITIFKELVTKAKSSYSKLYYRCADIKLQYI